MAGGVLLKYLFIDARVTGLGTSNIYTTVWYKFHQLHTLLTLTAGPGTLRRKRSEDGMERASFLGSPVD